MAYIKIGFPEVQELMEEEDFMDNAVATNEPGVYLVDEDWLDEFEE
jgi:hypothetical protein